MRTKCILYWQITLSQHHRGWDGSAGSCMEALSHLRQGYHAPPLAPRVPHAHRLWASSADLGPHPFAAASTRGASYQPGHGLHPCPRHSLRPAGHPGPYSQTQTPSGTLHLPTPSRGALRTAGHRPKTQVPRPHGHRRQGPEWARAAPHAPAASEEPQHIHWNRSRAGLSSCPGFAQGPRPLGGSGTLHCTGSLHTGGGLHPHTCNLWVPQLTRPTGAPHCTQLVRRTRACLRELPPLEVQGGGEMQGRGAGLSCHQHF